ncbi:acyl-CoA-binding domain-containing protein 3-like [Bidens hawaiensis]|uniref:acyl-CoA-binding domain-containing protein 3-like n=1 Tax=Bidens hawaiensis TaxID=980011 RepID=UPI00404B3EC7
MELFQELLFTISFSFIVSLLIAKLFAASSCDDDDEEDKIEKKHVCVEDPVKLSVGDELGSGVVIKDVETVGGVGVRQVFDEMPQRNGVDDAVVDSVEIDKGNVVECESTAIVDDDDWQGIETTELDKRFGAAVAFMDSKSGADRVNLVDNEVKVQLYGLHKVAIQGSCFEPQPMALKVSARANWNSWKRLENLGREDAMEQYIALLSQHVPDWMGKQ